MKKFMLMLGGICSLFIFAGCSESPTDAVTKWSAAIIIGDEAMANKESTEDSQMGNKALIARIKQDPEHVVAFQKEISEIIAGEEVIEGDRAEIKVDGKVKMVLKKVNDKWLVDLPGMMASKENGYSPQEVVTKWAEAIVAGDKVTADLYVMAASRMHNEEFIKTCENDAIKTQFKSFISQIPDTAEINGDTASVKFGTSKLILKKIKGNWVIDFLSTATQSADSGPAIKKDWSSPQVVVRLFGEAVLREKLIDAMDFVTQDSNINTGLFAPEEDEKVEFQNKLNALSDDKFVITGDTAEVKFDAETTFYLRKIDGKWLLDLNKSVPD